MSDREDPPIETPTTTHGNTAAVLAVALLAGLFGALTVPSGFVFDDDFLVFQDDEIRALNPLVTEARYRDILSSHYWRPIREAGLYRPLTIASFAAQMQLQGITRPLPGAAASILGAPASVLPTKRPVEPQAAPFHAVNLALHVLCTALLTVLLLPFGISVALLAGVVFALHPIHLEAISLITGRADLLAAALGLLALVAHRRARIDGERSSSLRALLPAFLLFCALLAKESIAPLPALALILDLALDKGRPLHILRRRAPLYLLEILALLLILLTRGVVLGELVPAAAAVGFVDNPLATVGAGERLSGAWRVLGLALRSCAWPTSLSIDYSFAAVEDYANPFDSQTILATAILMAAIIVGIVVRRSRPGILAGLALFLVAYSPVSHVLFPTGTYFGERTLYLPTIGFALAVGSAFRPLARGGVLRHAPPLLIGLALLASLLVSVPRVQELRDDDSAWKAVTVHRPGSAKGWLNHAIGAIGNNLFEEADRRNEIAIEIAGERYAKAWELAGQIAEIQSRYTPYDEQEKLKHFLQEAVQHYRKMAEVAEAEPETSRQGTVVSAVVHECEDLAVLERFGAAQARLSKIEKRYPDDPRIQLALAKLELARRKPGLASARCARLLAALDEEALLAGDDSDKSIAASAHYFLADAARQQEQPEIFERELQQAVRWAILGRGYDSARAWSGHLSENDPQSQALRALSLFQDDSPAEALKSAQRAAELAPERKDLRAMRDELERMVR
ncbi:MAG: hypothetical protein RL885_03530 [Planctomycetota bacterium]